MTQLTVTKQPSAVAPWAGREDVRELAERLQTMMPGAQSLTKVEALALAQAAVAHGLDPFNGELWFLKDKQGRPLGLMAGIKGHRRAAHRQIREEGGGNYWPEFEVLATDEKAALGIPANALAYRCKIRDTQTVNQYVGEIERLLDKDLPWEVVCEIVGHKPYTEGIGYATPNEPSRMTLVQRAMKRAEADALKRRFDLPFGVMLGTNGDSVIEGEFIVEDDTPHLSEKTVEQLDNAEEKDTEAWQVSWHALTHRAIQELGYRHPNHIVNTLRKELDDEGIWWTPEGGLIGDADELWATLEEHKAIKAEQTEMELEQ